VTPLLLAASDYGLVVGVVIILALFVVVGWVILVGTRAQLHWRKRVEEGDVEIIRILVEDEVARWKTARTPKGVDPSAWRGVQAAELAAVEPDGVRLNTSTEGRYEGAAGERREVSTALDEGMRVTAKLADMALYDIPNVRLPYVRVDVYSTFRGDGAPAQRCILTTTARREIADVLDWDELTAEEVVRAFNGRYLLDDRGNPLPIDPDAGATGVPAAFYRDGD
jgi:hypothetical protein